MARTPHSFLGDCFPQHEIITDSLYQLSTRRNQNNPITVGGGILRRLALAPPICFLLASLVERRYLGHR